MSAKGTPWFKLHSQLREHPKTEDLADTLGIEKAHALGHLVCFWCWALDFYPDGHLGRMLPRRIESAAEWTGERGAFLAAMIQVGFIDDNDGGELVIHNRLEYAGSYRRAQDRKRQRDTAEPNTPTPVVLSRDSRATVATMSPTRRATNATGEGEGEGEGEENENEMERERESPPSVGKELSQGQSGDNSDLAALPDDTPLQPADIERLLSRKQLGAPSVLRRVGGGTATLGKLSAAHTAYPVLAGELKVAVAKAADGAKGPNYVATVIAGRREDAIRASPTDVEQVAIAAWVAADG